MTGESEGFRIAFVNLKTHTPCYFAGFNFTLEHVGIGYLTAVLRHHGYEVAIIDAATRDLSDEEVANELLDFSPTMVGFSPTVATMESAIRISNLLKKADRGLHICLGGHHATFLAEQILREEPCFDSVVRGEGEITIVDLADRLRRGAPLRDTLGLYLKNMDSSISKNPSRHKIEDLDAIPFPARDALQWQIREGKSPTVRVISSRGCVADCSFCSIPPFERLQKGQLWRARSAENVLDELKALREKFGIRTVLFAEDNFIGPGDIGRERVKRIAEGMISRGLGLNFRILCTAESLIKSEELLPLLKKAGLERVIVGIESASPSALRAFNKKSTVEQHYLVANILPQHDIILQLGFMMFYPYSSADDLRRNAEFLNNINQACFFQHFSNRMELYPGVAIFKRLDYEDMILSKAEYKKAFLYRYAEPNIGRLARSLSPVRRKTVNLDRYLLDMDIWVNQHKGKASNRNLVETYTGLRDKFSSKNMEFFLRSVGLTESEWDPEAFEELKTEHSNAIEKLRETLRAIVDGSGLKIWDIGTP